LILRELAWTDFADWVEMYYARYEEILTNPSLGVLLREPRPSLADEAEFFGRLHRQILDGHVVCCVAEDDGHVVGTCSITRKGDHVEDRHVGTLAIGVRADRRGRGVGAALMQRALERCRGRFEVVELGVLAPNETAQRLYQKFGFQECGRLPRAFKRGGTYYDEVLMSRPVEPGP
jgi:RimJ/RimL family protein N-acetyltransferase